MAEVSQISEFGKILIFLITGIIMVCVAFFINRMLAPHKPNPEKLTSYECGEEVTGNAWLPFNSRFYVIALIFLLFDVEMVFIFPWATVFGSHEISNYEPRWGVLSLIEMFVFLGILILGLAYVWVKGDLEWIKPKPVTPVTDAMVPKSAYELFNEEQSKYKVKAFTAPALVTVPPVTNATVETSGTIETTATGGTPETVGTPGTPGTPPIRKPMFKPTFKKPANEQ